MAHTPRVPIYEYRCAACGADFEELVRGPSAAVACPTCGDERPERRLSTFAGSLGGAPSADYSRLGHHSRASGCCGGGACGHRH